MSAAPNHALERTVSAEEIKSVLRLTVRLAGRSVWGVRCNEQHSEPTTVFPMS